QPTAEKFSPRLGVLYKLTNELSAYASYSQSLGSSTSAVSFNNTPFPPQTGEQYETGVKASMLDGKLTASLTLFDLYLRNRLTSDPAH
ncbi:TonB-dependent receptor domain-containing protein, partial [Klebsiella pneumoniae]|uniref:TonB-dependent receptor domain-containing protein n=1 Tax=Klebsiella pneumoniae TaxID=573 RepID=UPI003D0766CB